VTDLIKNVHEVHKVIRITTEFIQAIEDHFNNKDQDMTYNEYLIIKEVYASKLE